MGGTSHSESFIVDTRILCLGALHRGPCSGYEIRKQFEEGPFAHFQDASFGSIYPALRKLMDERLVTCTEQAQDSRPDKKVYALTSAGHQALVSALVTDASGDKVRSDCLFTLFFAELLPVEEIEAILERRIEYHRVILEAMQDCSEETMQTGHVFVKGIGETIHRACLEYLTANRPRLIAALEARCPRERGMPDHELDTAAEVHSDGAST